MSLNLLGKVMEKGIFGVRKSLCKVLEVGNCSVWLGRELILKLFILR